MGGERQVEKKEQVVQQQTTVQQTPEEQELNKLFLERQRAVQEGTISVQQQGLSLINQLLTGQDLPGFLGQLPGGISSEAIGQQATRLAGKNLAGFQGLGLADSGVAFRETAKDIGENLLFPAEQFNLQNISQLLNLAVGGQAQIQQPITAGGAVLSGALAGLRGTSQVGTGVFTTRANPFLDAFQKRAGESLATTSTGGRSFGFGSFNIGGA